MKMKLLGAAVAAALLGLSTASFGQASGASGQDTPLEAGAAKAGPGNSAPDATTGSASSSATTGSTVTTNCDSLSGAAKTRCMREQGASSGSSTTAPTSQPGQSGPGTSDKTDPKNPNAPGAGTSSAGSSN